MRPILIRGGRVFDGSGGPGRDQDILIQSGQIAAIAPGIEVSPDAETVDASGCWVTPGFIDNHTHYDAELEVSPALAESVRHGVTTVTIGSCGLGMALGQPEELADMFCRVEGIPRSVVKPLLERVKDWDTPSGYLAHLGALPLGPNVAVLLGHSTIRAAVLGLGRSLDRRVRPSAAELGRMGKLLEDALESGYLGLSINTLRWDKMDGENYRSLPTPSTFASWSEYRYLNNILRRRNRLWQGVPNVSTKLNLLFFLMESSGILRPRLRTAVISLIDTKANRWTMFLGGLVASVFNRFFRADFRFQSLPCVFDFWVDGIEVPVFEEIGAGTEALNLQNEHERRELLLDAKFRKKFRRQWTSVLWGRAYHRDLNEARVMDCPDSALVGRSFGEIARARHQHAVDTFLDLVAEYGSALRWYTVLGNDRPRWLRWIVNHPSVLIGFSDAGAHLRNMAHYNFPLRLLAQVKDDASDQGQAIGRAVYRLTGEIADWMGIEGGRLEVGSRADIAVIDPQGLDHRLEEMHMAPMDGFDGLERLVRRNDQAVRAVFINGRWAAGEGRLASDLGRHSGYGQVIRAQQGPP